MLSWNEERHALGAPEMDATHREFATLAKELALAGKEDFPLLFEALVDHTRSHFENESRLMRACRFPAIAEHEGEHQRVLGELARLQRGIDEGRVAFARTYVREGLPDWFANHLATMDAALAACLKVVR
ncbi:Bacteriohemerythrin [Rhodocyclaceae bacterium]|nr:Bacteriohemerythrin [Rhodocyclaceae bacterium]